MKLKYLENYFSFKYFCFVKKKIELGIEIFSLLFKLSFADAGRIGGGGIGCQVFNNNNNNSYYTGSVYSLDGPRRGQIGLDYYLEKLCELKKITTEKI